MNMQYYTITEEMVNAAGISIPDDEIEVFLDYTNEQLDERIGETITELLDDKQLEELLDLQESNSEDAVLAWIHENVTDLDEIVQDEMAILLADIAEEKDAINLTV